MFHKFFKKKRFKVTILSLATTLLVNIGMIPVMAADGYVCDHGYHTFGDYTLNGGVGNYGYTNRYYWVNSNFNSTYVTYIKKAVDEWIHTTDSVGVTTPISIVKTSEKSKSVFDVHPSYLGSNVLGMTEFYKSGKKLDINNNGALTQNYGYTYIYISTAECDRLLSESQRKATVAHEFGHAMGLSHKNTVAKSIMCQAKTATTTRTATRANADDLKTINHLYK